MNIAWGNLVKTLTIYLVPLLFFFLENVEAIPGQLSYDNWTLLLTIIWMIIWWMSDIVPRALTSMIPIIIFPYLGIFNIEEVAQNYSNSYSFLFLGGFLLAIALEKFELHKFFAVKIINLIGFSSKKIIFAVMISTFFISMFITNTATVMMMLPLVLSFIDNIDSNSPNCKNFKISLLIAVAFGATIGGIATIYGTPPNLILASFVKINFEQDLSIYGWMKFAFPLAIILFIITYIALNIVYPCKLENEDIAPILNNFIDNKLNFTQKIVLTVFLVNCLFLTFRPLINILLNWNLNDAAIALTSSFILFIIPINLSKKEFLLSWEDSKKVPWEVLFLFGGSIAISNAITQTGLYDYITEQFKGYIAISEFMAIIFITLICLFLTEFISNTALSLAMIPIIFSLALTTGNNPLILGIIATISINCAFVLYIATPPNSMIMINNNISANELGKIGIIIKSAAFIAILIFAYFELFNSYNLDIQLLPTEHIEL